MVDKWGKEVLLHMKRKSLIKLLEEELAKGINGMEQFCLYQGICEWSSWFLGWCSAYIKGIGNRGSWFCSNCSAYIVKSAREAEQ